MADPTVQAAYYNYSTGTGSGTGNTAHFGASNTAGNTIVVTIWDADGTSPTPSDTNANTYTKLATTVSTTDGRAGIIWYALGIAAGANTVNLSGLTQNAGFQADVVIACLELPASGGVRTSGSATNTTAVSPNCTMSGATLTNDVVVLIADGHGTTQTAGSIGSNLGTIQGQSSFTDLATESGYASAGTITCSTTGVMPAGTTWSALAIALKPPTAAVSDTIPMIGGGRQPSNQTYLKMRDRERAKSARRWRREGSLWV